MNPLLKLLLVGKSAPGAADRRNGQPPLFWPLLTESDERRTLPRPAGLAFVFVACAVAPHEPEHWTDLGGWTSRGRSVRICSAMARRKIPPQAALWYRKPADQGYALAQAHLGLMHEHATECPGTP